MVDTNNTGALSTRALSKDAMSYDVRVVEGRVVIRRDHLLSNDATTRQNPTKKFGHSMSSASPQYVIGDTSHSMSSARQQHQEQHHEEPGTRSEKPKKLFEPTLLEYISTRLYTSIFDRQHSPTPAPSDECESVSENNNPARGAEIQRSWGQNPRAGSSGADAGATSRDLHSSFHDSSPLPAEEPPPWCAPGSGVSLKQHLAPWNTPTLVSPPTPSGLLEPSPLVVSGSSPSSSFSVSPKAPSAEEDLLDSDHFPRASINKSSSRLSRSDCPRPPQSSSRPPGYFSHDFSHERDFSHKHETQLHDPRRVEEDKDPKLDPPTNSGVQLHAPRDPPMNSGAQLRAGKSPYAAGTTPVGPGPGTPPGPATCSVGLPPLGTSTSPDGGAGPATTPGPWPTPGPWSKTLHTPSSPDTPWTDVPSSAAAGNVGERVARLCAGVSSASTTARYFWSRWKEIENLLPVCEFDRTRTRGAPSHGTGGDGRGGGGCGTGGGGGTGTGGGFAEGQEVAGGRGDDDCGDDSMDHLHRPHVDAGLGCESTPVWDAAGGPFPADEDETGCPVVIFRVDDFLGCQSISIVHEVVFLVCETQRNLEVKIMSRRLELMNHAAAAAAE